MKVTMLIFALIGICLAETQIKSVSERAVELGFNTFDHQFNSFKINFQKSYANGAEEETRKLNFLLHLQTITEHNELFKRGLKSFELGVNQFSDMTAEEYQSMFSSQPNPLVQKPEPVNAYIRNNASQINAPASWDWRQSGKVTPVKNQGGCGSCWAFSVVGAVEGIYAVKHNQNLDLSEEQLVDCTNSRCGGQWIYDGFKYVIAHGVENEGQYPYTAGSGHYNPCQENAGAPHTHIRGYASLGRGISDQHPLATDGEIMDAVMNNGPISVMFNAAGGAFQGYRSGVLDENDMGWTGSHAVLIIGWGNENGKNYWLLKNSWGTGWGDGGFFKMLRGNNLRHVNEYLYFPTL